MFYSVELYLLVTLTFHSHKSIHTELLDVLPEKRRLEDEGDVSDDDSTDVEDDVEVILNLVFFEMHPLLVVKLTKL